MKKRVIIAMAAAILVMAALAAFIFSRWTDKENTLEQAGLAAILDKVKETEEFPEHGDIAYLGASITEKGEVTDFTLTVTGFDDQDQYISHVGYTYDSETQELSCREYQETALPIYYDPNADFTYIDEQIRRIPFEAQIRLLDFDRFQVEFQPDIQLEAGTPVLDGSGGQDFPVLTWEEYQQGQGGVSDGSSALAISLTDGTGATGKRLEYYCEAADTSALSGHPETVMQMDYRINNGDLLLTGDAGESWVSTGLSSQQVSETTDTYQRGGSLFEDSYFADGNGVYAVFYGETPTLRLSRDKGATWQDILFTDYMPRLCTRRIVRFLDSENGYAGLGTDWTMGSGGATYVYWTHDGGETWTSSTELYEEAMMLDGLAFSDTSHGVASLQTVNGDEQYPALRVTTDGGASFTELVLPWESLPSSVSFLDKVDSLTAEGGVFTLTLGQGTAGNTKAVFTSTDLTQGWTFKDSFQGTIHTEG